MTPLHILLASSLLFLSVRCVTASGVDSSVTSNATTPTADEQKAVAEGGAVSQEPLVAGKPFVVRSIGLVMEPVPAGTLRVPTHDPETPFKDLTIEQPYWIGRTEVTQAQWQAVMGDNPSHFKGENLPVENVTHYRAGTFAEVLTDQERAAGRLPQGYVYALPTAVQWEYALRAGSKAADVENSTAIAWNQSNSGERTHPVATKKPNAFGLYDMVGNVSEWLADREDHGNNAYNLHAGRSWSSGDGRVLSPQLSRIGGYSFEEERSEQIGLRIVLVPVDGGDAQ